MNVTIACICPGTPHEEDTVTLKDRLDFMSAAEARMSVLSLDADERANTNHVLAVLDRAYLIVGIEAWSLVDEKGKAVAVSLPAIEASLLSHPAEALQIADVAEDLYNPVVLVPLVKKASTSSQDGPTGSTSPTTGSTPKPPKPLKPSLTSITRTEDTEPISA